MRTRDDFATFLDEVSADLRGSGAAEWENGTLERFLDAFAAVAGACTVDPPGQVQERPSWALFAELVRAATYYE
ncbi:DUF7660 family protein [Pilimelia columellifera]|uniref:DUF7660 family protein n=1 Tax=Pilimelia columellifera TaxID=706574 RepID=UPI0031D234EA